MYTEVRGLVTPTICQHFFCCIMKSWHKYDMYTCVCSQYVLFMSLGINVTSLHPAFDLFTRQPIVFTWAIVAQQAFRHPVPVVAAWHTVKNGSFPRNCHFSSGIVIYTLIPWPRIHSFKFTVLCHTEPAWLDKQAEVRYASAQNDTTMLCPTASVNTP